MPLICCCIFLFTAYALLILHFTRGWNAIPVYTPSAPASLKLSVVIPARNEEKNIGHLLDALQAQDYPAALTEIIVADDASEDTTADIVRRYPGVKLLIIQHTGNGPAYKKNAVAAAVQAATGEYIVCTDADCVPGPAWLSTIASFISDKKAVFVAAPVSFRDTSSLLSVFQSLDFMILQGITGAAVHNGSLAMSNGANLAYSKNVFLEADGFNGIDHIASGDDMLLMQKIKDLHPDKIGYLRSKQAIVQTDPMPDWRSFFRQRIRWASKSAHFRDTKIKLILLLVYLYNLSFIVLAIASFFNPAFLIWLAGSWIAKTVIESPFLTAVARFFDKTRLLKYFFFVQPLHIVYTVISGLFSQFGTYEWKGRHVR